MQTGSYVFSVSDFFMGGGFKRKTISYIIKKNVILMFKLVGISFFPDICCLDLRFLWAFSSFCVAENSISILVY